MQKDNAPETLLRNDPPYNGICAYAFLPVFRIDRLANGEVLIALRLLDRYKFLIRLRFGIGVIGGAKQNRCVTREALDYQSCRIQFKPRPFPADLREIRMCERVVAYLMTFVVDLFDQLHVVFRIQSNQKESAGDMFFFQHLQNLRSIFRVGAVIKCKHDLLLGLAESSYDV